MQGGIRREWRRHRRCPERAGTVLQLHPDVPLAKWKEFRQAFDRIGVCQSLDE
jgi:hypothetical protein